MPESHLVDIIAQAAAAIRAGQSVPFTLHVYRPDGPPELYVLLLKEQADPRPILHTIGHFVGERGPVDEVVNLGEGWRAAYAVGTVPRTDVRDDPLSDYVLMAYRWRPDGPLEGYHYRITRPPGGAPTLEPDPPLHGVEHALLDAFASGYFHSRDAAHAR
jgi:hypothetical protein